MQTIFINYATVNFQRRQRMNSLSALVKGHVDQCLQYGPDSLDAAFLNRNRFILSLPRGAGHWVWKPQIILDAMNQSQEGDVIIYCDSGSLVTGDLGVLAKACRELDTAVLGFKVGPDHIERHWTKRDTLQLMGCDSPEYRDTAQMRAGTIVFNVSRTSRLFVEEWARLVCQLRLVSDMPTLCAEPEYADFQEHRHDQTIFSLLYKKNGFHSCEDLTGKTVAPLVKYHIGREPSWPRVALSWLHPVMHLRCQNRHIDRPAT